MFSLLIFLCGHHPWHDLRLNYSQYLVEVDHHRRREASFLLFLHHYVDFVQHVRPLRHLLLAHRFNFSCLPEAPRAHLCLRYRWITHSYRIFVPMGPSKTHDHHPQSKFFAWSCCPSCRRSPTLSLHQYWLRPLAQRHLVVQGFHYFVIRDYLNLIAFDWFIIYYIG